MDLATKFDIFAMAISISGGDDKGLDIELGEGPIQGFKGKSDAVKGEEGAAAAAAPGTAGAAGAKVPPDSLESSREKMGGLDKCLAKKKVLVFDFQI